MTREKTKEWRKRSMTWGKRLVFTLILMGVGFYFVLSMAERSREPIRKGIQDYLEQATGEIAEINDVTKVDLVPTVTFNIEGILVRDRATREKSLVKAQSAYLSLPTPSLIFGSGKYHAFQIKGLEIATGYLFPKKLNLSFAGIADPDPGLAESYFLMDGTYNNLPLLVTAGMTMNTRGKRPLYYFQDRFPVTMKIGESEASGSYVRGWNGVNVEEVVFTREGQIANFNVKDIQKNPLSGKIVGKIQDVEFAGVIAKRKEQIVLIISLGQADAQSVKKVASFLNDIKKDLGLGSESDPVVIEIQNTSEGVE